VSSDREQGTEIVSATGILIGADERAAVDRVLTSGMIAQGPEVAAFEAEFAAVVDGRPCVAVSSGTSALLLGLLAIGIEPGDEVIVPSFSFAATANAVVLAGATPVFVDIEPRHFCLDPAAVLDAITGRTAAIMAVHLYGHPAAMDRIADIARRRGLALVEDAAQAHLAQWGGRAVGTFGDVAAFSFYPTKNMTCGEGGLVVCADEAVARRVRLLRNQGMERRYVNEIVGYNARMTDLHAAIGRVQLRRLPEWTSLRRANAAFLSGALKDLGLNDVELDDVGLNDVAELVVPAVAPHAEPVWHQYTVRVPARDRFVATLAGLGVRTGVYYPTPIHRLPAYDLDLDLPATAAAARDVVSLPVHPALTPGQRERIVTAVSQALREAVAA
jgi:dTDP-4-amino-4,6-dideoxygalactose transaminase